MPTLELSFKKKRIENYPIGAGDTLLIGRNKVNDIVIDNLAVSSQHAKIESIGDRFLFVDLQSENGSFVNDQHVRSHWLNHGDAVLVGKHILKFSNPSDIKSERIKSAGNTRTMKIDTKKFRELINKNKNDSLSGGKLIKVKDSDKKEQIGVLSFLNGKKQNIQLNAKMIRIGKDPNSDILIKGLIVGKTSVVINKLPDGWHINCAGGFLKPRINNKALLKPVKLENLDIIKIGSTKLQFLIFGGSA